MKDRSSRYSRENCIRKKGSYLYEDFVATDGTDVKVYTVGPNYAHAEARKSPVSVQHDYHLEYMCNIQDAVFMFGLMC